jgi:TolA-binding protein
MRKFAFILTPLVALLLSCVYYNTFYNAKQGFKRAEKSQQIGVINQARTNTNRPPRAAPPQEPSISINDKNLYKESIDRANKVITFNPKSKYVDDALWLIGKSRYNMGEYISSDKRLGELVTTYPNSQFVDGAQYYIGMSQFWLKDYPKALEAFGRISEKKKSDYKSQAAYMIAYMDYVQGNFQSSLDGFSKFLKDYKDADSAGSAQFFVGVCLDSLKQYQDARLAYWNVLKYSPPFNLEFDAKFAAGLAAFKQDSLATGNKIFSDLAKQPRFFDKSSMLRLRLADGKQLSDSTDAAISEYNKIIEEFPNTPEAAEASYRLGAIYEDQNDFTKAKDFYNKAAQGTQDPLIRNLALTHSAQISKLENYRARLAHPKSEAPTDSLNKAKSDSLNLTKVDSLGIATSDSLNIPETDSLPITLNDSLAMADSTSPANPPAIFADTTKKADNFPAIPPRDSLPPPGPDFLARMMQQDSMKPPDTTLRQAMPGSPAGLPMPGLPFGPVAGLDTSRMSSHPHFLPDTTGRPNPPPRDTTKQITGLPDTSAGVTDDASIRFLLAELYDQELGRPDSALSEYLLLAEEYPESPYAPQALLAAAFICEKKADTSAARALYNRIASTYPATIQARYASARADSVQIPIENDVFALYNRAESLYFDGNNPDSAVKFFTYIEQNFPNSDFAPKSAYARAWVLDKTLASDGDSSAYRAYQEVLDKYPDSPYIYQTKIKLGLIEDTTLIAITTQTQQNQSADSAYQDSLAQSLTDTTNNTGFSLPKAPPVKDTCIFLYPGGLLSRNLKGRVTFKIRLDQFGHVSDYQLLGPSGELAIDSAAIKCLNETTFDMSKFTDMSYLNDYYRYDIKFAPPKIDEFYNPYQKREETGP